MDITDAALLIAAGLGAGSVNAVAGGGSLVTFPTLVAIGLPQIAANVTNSIAVCPGYLSSIYGTRTDLRELNARVSVSRLAPAAIGGSAAGCFLLLRTPADAFAWIVPFLVLGAAAVLAFQRRLRAVVGHPHDMPPRRRAVALHATVALAAVYGGYFGAALGVMLVAALGLVLNETLVRISALKNAISAVVGLVTVVLFAVAGPVNWAAVAVLAPATLAGGYAGARLARRLPANVLRAVIVAFGTVVGIVLLAQAMSG